MGKTSLDLHLTKSTNIDFRGIIDLDVPGKTIKLLEEGRGGCLHDLEVSKDFLNWTKSIVIKV